MSDHYASQPAGQDLLALHTCLPCPAGSDHSIGQEVAHQKGQNIGLRHYGISLDPKKLVLTHVYTLHQIAITSRCRITSGKKSL